MTLKVFIEYKIKSEQREMFLSLIPEIKKYKQSVGVKSYKIFEGMDQSNLFVEEYFVNGKKRYEELKNERQNQREDLWLKMSNCVDGGMDKINIWAFKEA